MQVQDKSLAGKAGVAGPQTQSLTNTGIATNNLGAKGVGALDAVQVATTNQGNSLQQIQNNPAGKGAASQNQAATQNGGAGNAANVNSAGSVDLGQGTYKTSASCLQVAQPITPQTHCTFCSMRRTA